MSSENDIIFNFRGRVIKLKKEDIPVFDWYIYNLIEDIPNDNSELYINEDLNAFLSIFESLRYSKLILFENVNLEYLLVLGEKWCISKELIDDINFEISKKKINKNTDEKIFQCINCRCGFKKSENFSDSCKFHSYGWCGIVDKFRCCGTTKEYCKISYHCPIE